MSSGCAGTSSPDTAHCRTPSSSASGMSLPAPIPDKDLQEARAELQLFSQGMNLIPTLPEPRPRRPQQHLQRRSCRLRRWSTGHTREAGGDGPRGARLLQASLPRQTPKGSRKSRKPRPKEKGARRPWRPPFQPTGQPRACRVHSRTSRADRNDRAQAPSGAATPGISSPKAGPSTGAGEAIGTRRFARAMRRRRGCGTCFWPLPGLR